MMIWQGSNQSRPSYSFLTSTIIVSFRERSNNLVNETGKKKSQAPVVAEPQAQPDLVNAATEGHFAPLKLKVKKVQSMVDNIIAHQQWEREKEAIYN